MILCRDGWERSGTTHTIPLGPAEKDGHTSRLSKAGRTKGGTFWLYRVPAQGLSSLFVRGETLISRWRDNANVALPPNVLLSASLVTRKRQSWLQPGLVFGTIDPTDQGQEATFQRTGL